MKIFHWLSSKSLTDYAFTAIDKISLLSDTVGIGAVDLGFMRCQIPSSYAKAFRSAYHCDHLLDKSRTI